MVRREDQLVWTNERGEVVAATLKDRANHYLDEQAHKYNSRATQKPDDFIAYNEEIENVWRRYLEKMHRAVSEDRRQRELAVLNRPISSREISAAIHSAKVNGATGEDALSVKFLREGFSALEEPIGITFNEMFLLQARPDSLNRRVIKLIHKGWKPRRKAGSYRPITLLAILGKQLDSIMNARFARSLPLVFLSSERAKRAQFAQLQGYYSCSFLF